VPSIFADARTCMKGREREREKEIEMRSLELFTSYLFTSLSFIVDVFISVIVVYTILRIITAVQLLITWVLRQAYKLT